MADRIERIEGGGVICEGRGVDVFAMLSIATALDLYARTGIKVNRAYTPAAMMRAASAHLGIKLKARDYAGAAYALRVKAAAERDRIAAGSAL